MSRNTNGSISLFLSTPSARRATNLRSLFYGVIIISIHALREEGDTSTLWSSSCSRYFYPRPPRGGRPASCSISSSSLYFYPRPPRGGRLLLPLFRYLLKIFLSTPSARRATYEFRSFSLSHLNFYPRPPRGGRPALLHLTDLVAGFLSTPSARRATKLPPRKRSSQKNFYPRPPRGGRPT